MYFLFLFLVVLIWFILSLLCAILLPNIGEAISFLGCLAAVFIFIIPGLCLFNLVLRSDPALLRSFNVALILMSGVLIVIGAFIFGVVFTQDIQQAMDQHGSTNMTGGFNFTRNIDRAQQFVRLPGYYLHSKNMVCSGL